MPAFTFTGINLAGAKITGERTAPSREGLAAQLKRERVQNAVIKSKSLEINLPSLKSSKVKTKDIAIFFRQFSVMVIVGLTVPSSACG